MRGGDIVLNMFSLRPLDTLVSVDASFFHEGFVDRVWKLLKIHLEGTNHKLTCHLHYAHTCHMLAHVYNWLMVHKLQLEKMSHVKNTCRFTDIFTSSQAFSVCYLNPHMRQSYCCLCFCRWRKILSGFNACRHTASGIVRISSWLVS